MFLSRLFKNARSKVMIALAGLTMVFGTAAAITTVTANQQNEVVETKAWGSSDSYLVHIQAWGSTSSWVDFNGVWSNNEVKFLHIYMAQNAQLGFKINNNGWYTPTPEGGSAGSFTVSGGNLKCGAAGWYDFYFKPNNGPGLYIGNSSMVSYNYSSATLSVTKIYYTVSDSASGGVSPGWPGIDASSSFKLPSTANLLIFSNGNGGDNKQTTDITPTGNNGDTYYIWSDKIWSDNNNKYIGHWNADRTGTFVVGDFNSWQATSSNILSDQGTTNWYQLLGVSMTGGQEWKVRLVSAWDASDIFYGWSAYVKDDSEANDTTDLFTGDGDSNITAGANGSYDIYWNGDTHKIYGYYNSSSSIAEGYYLCGDGVFTTNSSYPFSLKYGIQMSEGDGVNTAYFERTNGFHVAKDTRMKPRRHQFCDNEWYTVTLGDGTGYSFAHVDAEDSNNIVFDKEGDYNFYFKASEHRLYIVDVGAIHTYGYVYFASTAASVTVDSYENSTQVLNDVAISDVTGTSVSNKVYSFNGITGSVKLYKIPIYNLRGKDAGKLVNKVVFNAGGSTYTMTGLPTSAGATPHYYSIVGVGGTGAVATTYGNAAKALFDLDAGMNDKSICEMDSSALGSLKSTIEAGCHATTGSFTLMDGAKLTSYADGDKSSTANWAISAIYKKICILTSSPSSIAGWPLPAGVIPSAMYKESPLTMTLWIVLGSGLAGLAAIGTAYFVSKKKKRYNA